MKAKELVEMLRNVNPEMEVVVSPLIYSQQSGNGTGEENKPEKRKMIADPEKRFPIEGITLCQKAQDSPEWECLVLQYDEQR